MVYKVGKYGQEERNKNKVKLQKKETKSRWLCPDVGSYGRLLGSYESTIIGDPTIEWVPIIRLYHKGDKIQWCWEWYSSHEILHNTYQLKPLLSKNFYAKNLKINNFLPLIIYNILQKHKCSIFSITVPTNNVSATLASPKNHPLLMESVLIPHLSSLTNSQPLAIPLTSIPTTNTKKKGLRKFHNKRKWRHKTINGGWRATWI